MFGVNVAENFTTADIHGKIIIGIFVALMCFCLWLMQYNSMKRNMVQSAANKQTEMMQKMMLWMFPIMYIFSGVAMPFAVLVYWLTNNICNLLRSVWQIHVFPTPGSPAAEAKEKRDHAHENARRAKAGLPSLEAAESQVGRGGEGKERLPASAAKPQKEEEKITSSVCPVFHVKHRTHRFCIGRIAHMIQPNQ